MPRTASSGAQSGGDRIVGGRGAHAGKRRVGGGGGRAGDAIEGEKSREWGQRQQQSARKKGTEDEHVRQEGTVSVVPWMAPWMEVAIVPPCSVLDVPV